VANIKSQEKRNLTNERRRLRNQSVKSSLRTAVRGFREAVEAGEKEKAAELLVSTSRKLDKAARVSSTPTRPRIRSPRWLWR
jgi:small subunit ribosomal protein S20